MSYLTSLDIQSFSEQSNQSRALRIIQNLNRNIEFYNKTNIHTPKFAYCSDNFSQLPSCLKKKPQIKQNDWKGFSERSSFYKVDSQANQQVLYSYEQKSQNIKTNSPVVIKNRKKMFMHQNKEKTRDRTMISNLYSVRQIKGIVFKQKQLQVTLKTTANA